MKDYIVHYEGTVEVEASSKEDAQRQAEELIEPFPADHRISVNVFNVEEVAAA